MALADPFRRSVIDRLGEGEESLTTLGEPFEMTMAAVMKHIAVLERTGIVTTEKRGRTRYCRLNPQQMKEAQIWIERHTKFWTERLVALDEFLKENP